MNLSYAGKNLFNGVLNRHNFKISYNLFRYFMELERNQWRYEHQINERSGEKLAALIKHAYQNVPYYKRVFDRYGIKSHDISEINDLNKIPILTKKTLQQQKAKDLLAIDVDSSKCIHHKTSGSTGKPLTICYTLEEYLYGSMTLSRANLANGKRPWHRQAYIKGPPNKHLQNLMNKSQRNKIYLKAGNNSGHLIKELNVFQPDIIYGYNNSLKLIAQAIRNSGRNSDIKPQAVFGYAELLDLSTRTLINNTFNVEMVDIYACMEAKCIAWECPDHKGYHINSDTTIVEFIKKDGTSAKPGESGRIVVTPLFLRSMPLIRYDTGDIGSALRHPCTCGRGLPLMKMIQGRSDDFITLKSGTVIPPVDTFAPIIEDEPHIIEYLLIQESYDYIDVKLVSNNGKNPKSLARIKRKIEKLTMNEAIISVGYVEQIDRGNEDKIRRIISKVPLISIYH